MWPSREEGGTRAMWPSREEDGTRAMWPSRREDAHVPSLLEILLAYERRLRAPHMHTLQD